MKQKAGLFTSVVVLILAIALPIKLSAEINKGQHLNNIGQSKIHGVLAKKYMSEGAAETQKLKEPQVNIGNRRAGNCTMNVGTIPTDSKSKLKSKYQQDVVVVSKDIINVCK